jgi:hypothetical protein
MAAEAPLGAVIPAPTKRPVRGPTPLATTKPGVREESVLEGVLALASRAFKAFAPTLAGTPPRAKRSVKRSVKRPANRAGAAAGTAARPLVGAAGAGGRFVDAVKVVDVIKNAGLGVLEGARSLVGAGSSGRTAGKRRR